MTPAKKTLIGAGVSAALAIGFMLVPTTPPQKKYFLTWDYPTSEIDRIDHFNVYTRFNADSGKWVLYAAIPANTQTVEMRATNSQSFFIVTAVDKNGIESLPNTK